MNKFKKCTLTIIFLALMCVIVGCDTRNASTDPPQSSEVTPEVSAPTPAPMPAPKIQITAELVNEIMQSQRVSYEQGENTPGSFEEFLQNNPNFIMEQSYRLSVSSEKTEQDVSEPVKLIFPKGIALENDILNRERIGEFVENFNNKTPDSIVVLSSKDPVPLWITTYTYDGGSDFTVQSCFLLMDKFKWQTPYKSQKIEETDSEWILLDDPMQQHNYTKYGYEPIPLSDTIGERSELDVLKIVDDLRQNQYPQADSIVSGEPQIIDDIPCFMFNLHQTINGKSIYTGYSFAVAKDLSRYYEIEQAHGQWVLQARPKMPPKK